MRNSFFIIILGLILGSCSANWHIKKAEQKCPACFKRDTTIQEIVFKLDTVIKIDTNINVTLPRDTVEIEKEIPKYVKIKPIKQKNGIITVEVAAKDGFLKIKSYLDSTMLYRYEDSIRIKNAKITRLNRETIKNGIIIQEKEEKLNKLQKTIKLIGLFTIIILVLLIIFRLLKNK